MCYKIEGLSMSQNKGIKSFYPLFMPNILRLHRNTRPHHPIFASFPLVSATLHLFRYNYIIDNND